MEPVEVIPVEKRSVEGRLTVEVTRLLVNLVIGVALVLFGGSNEGGT